ncbi:MAG: hypothetical protein AAFQ78_00160, partial [Bacteroidota bacterium]
MRKAIRHLPFCFVLLCLHACGGNDFSLGGAKKTQPKPSQAVKIIKVPVPEYDCSAPFEGRLLGGMHQPDDEDRKQGHEEKKRAATILPPSVARQLTYEPTDRRNSAWDARIATARRKSLEQITTDTKRLIAEADRIKNTAALVKGLNNPRKKAADKRTLRRIFKAYNVLFLGQSFAECDKGDIHRYSLLAKVKPSDDDMRELLETYVEVWREKTEANFDFKKYARGIEAFLQEIDEQAFKGDPTLLTKLGLSLLDTLPSGKSRYTASTYPAYKNTLNALHHALVKIRNIAQDKWSPKDKQGLYTQFKAKLDTIEQSPYYPFQYQAKLLKQSLVLLREKPKASHPAWRVYYGAKGGLQLVQSIMGAALLEFDFGNFEGGLANIAGAIVGDTDNPDGNIQDAAKLISGRMQRLKVEPWYRQAQGMLGQALRCIQPGAADAHEEAYYKYRSALNKVLENPPNKERERTPLYYSIARQLTMIGLKGTKGVSKLSLAQFRQLLKDEKWRKREAVLTELLTGLAMIATQHEGEAIRQQARDILL